MPHNKIIYYLTWVALALLLMGGLLLLALSWGSFINGRPSPMLMIFIWILISASGIFLFMLAVKKAHRQWIDQERSLKEKADEVAEKPSSGKDVAKDKQSLDFSATARKLVRRIPENASLEDVAEELLKNLAKELEIMSGIVYIREKNLFKASSTYALKVSEEAYSFKEGEGLTGQVARNRQIMVLTKLPKEYLEVFSGLGSSMPTYLAIVPFMHKEQTVAVLECSGFRYDPHDIENMFRIFSRDIMEKLSPNLK